MRYRCVPTQPGGIGAGAMRLYPAMFSTKERSNSMPQQDSCGDADEIQIRSSVPGTQRTWEGPGTFSMTDVDVRDQKVPGGSTLPLQILVSSGTNSGNNTGGQSLSLTPAPVHIPGLAALVKDGLMTLIGRLSAPAPITVQPPMC